MHLRHDPPFGRPAALLAMCAGGSADPALKNGSLKMKQLINRALGLLDLEIRRKAPLVQQQKFQPYVKQFAIAGVEFSFWVADETGHDWYSPADFPRLSEHAETAKLLRPGDRVLEIGSHHGFTTLMIAKMVGPSGFVLGVEPFAFQCNGRLRTMRSQRNPKLQASPAGSIG